MSRRRLQHQRYATQQTLATRKPIDVVEWRQDRGIEPRGIALQRGIALARKLGAPLPSRHHRGMP